MLINLMDRAEERKSKSSQDLETLSRSSFYSSMGRTHATSAKKLNTFANFKLLKVP